MRELKTLEVICTSCGKLNVLEGLEAASFEILNENTTCDYCDAIITKEEQ